MAVRQSVTICIVIQCTLFYKMKMSLMKILKSRGPKKAYELQPLAEQRSVVNDHVCYSATKFAVCVTEAQDKLPTLCWLPKLLFKRPYKAQFIANSSSCTTIEVSKLLTSCLTAIKKTCN